MKAIFSSFIIFISTSAFAEFSYDYISVGYGETEVDVPGSDVDFEGWGIEISKDLSDDIFLAVKYSDSDVEIDDVTVGDIQDYSFEIGGHSSITDELDVVFSVALGQEDFEGIKTEYYAVLFDFRYWVVEGLVEIDANLGYLNSFESDVSLSDEDTALYGVGLRVQPIPEASIGVSYGTAEAFDEDGFIVDLRYHF